MTIPFDQILGKIGDFVDGNNDDCTLPWIDPEEPEVASPVKGSLAVEPALTKALFFARRFCLLVSSTDASAMFLWE